MTFEELEHTADVRMKIFGETLSEIFSEAGYALSKTLYGEYPKDTPTQEIEIFVSGTTFEELVVNFLSELLFQMEIEYLVPQKISTEVFEEHASGKISGTAFDPKKHSGGTGVKGVSYSELSLTKTALGYELIIIFDI